MSASIAISIVIPVYRSASTLPELIGRLTAVLDRMGVEYELILVEDGSPDDSWSVLQRLHRQYDDRLTAVRLMRNFGQHNALMCGFRMARGDFVVTLDDDLQNPPEEIPALYREIVAGDMDVVYGEYGDKRHAGWRNAGSWVANSFFRCVFRHGVTITSFRIIRRPVLQSLFSYDLNYTFIDGLLAWNTQRIGKVAVAHHPRADGRSGYTLAKLISLSLNLFTNFSLLPLQAISCSGVAFASLGFLGAVYYFTQGLLANIAVPGYASLMIAILILGGMQLLSLGVMGEYLGRLHLNMNRKPQYVVRQALGRSDVESSSLASAA